MRRITTLIVHCSDTLGGDVEAIRRYHTMPVEQGGRGFSDIGYHFVILPTGLVQVGRPESVIGAHCKNFNEFSIGFCLIGKKEFSEESIAALKLLLQSLMGKYGLVSDNVYGHYEFDSAKAQGKTCPNLSGDYLRALVKEKIP